MEENWKESLRLIRAEEGGNDDDPHDRGGRTSRGIIQREYDAYRRHKQLPQRDVWKADDAEIDEIYYISYWQPWCSQMPAGVDLFLFNMSVNAGPVRGIILLQRALGVNDDGHIGIITRTAIAHTPSKNIITNYATATRKWYRGLRDFRYFGRGWLNRTMHIENAALKMVKA